MMTKKVDLERELLMNAETIGRLQATLLKQKGEIEFLKTLLGQNRPNEDLAISLGRCYEVVGQMSATISVLAKEIANGK